VPAEPFACKSAKKALLKQADLPPRALITARRVLKKEMPKAIMEDPCGVKGGSEAIQAPPVQRQPFWGPFGMISLPRRALDAP
jgi:hypothetical protein